jgi:hypothetical protein
VGADLHDRRPGDPRTVGFTIADSVTVTIGLAVTISNGLTFAVTINEPVDEPEPKRQSYADW